MAKFNTKSISNRGTFCNFSLAPKRKIYKTSMKHLKIHKFSFKNVIALAIGAICTWKFSKNFAALVAFQNRPCAPPWRKQGWIPRRTISWWKASLPPQKKAEHSFELSLSIFVFWPCIFNLEMQNFCLNTSAWWSRGSHFFENGHPSLRFPNMVKVNIHEHWMRVTRFNPLWVSGINEEKLY